MRFIQTIVASWIAVVLCTTGCATLMPTKHSAPPRQSVAPATNSTDDPAISIPESGAGPVGVGVNKPGANAQSGVSPTVSDQPPERTVRGQTPRNWFAPVNEPTAGNSDHWRRPMQASGEPVTRGQSPSYGYPAPQNYQPQGGYNNGSPVAEMVQYPLPAPPPAFPGVLPPGNAEPLMQPEVPLPP
ncbi:MAG: hypothetical protein ABI614_10160, partial [Planctomycetota bacterium]